MHNYLPELYIDKDGKWYADGVHMFRLDIVKLLAECILPLPDGGYEILWNGRKYPIIVEDVPFVIENINSTGDNVNIQLADSRIIDFNPSELCIVNDIAYVSLYFTNDTRFSRKAQWMLNSYLTEENDQSFLLLPNKNIPIRFL